MKELIAIFLVVGVSAVLAEPVIQADTNRILTIATNAIATYCDDLSVTNLDMSRLTYFSDGRDFHDVFVEFRDRTPIIVPEVDPNSHKTSTNVHFKVVIVRMDQNGTVKSVSPPRETRTLRLLEYFKNRGEDVQPALGHVR